MTHFGKLFDEVCEDYKYIGYGSHPNLKCLCDYIIIIIIFIFIYWSCLILTLNF
jgi:hypothetical protein